MAKDGRATIWSFIGSHLLLCVLCVQLAFVIATAVDIQSLGTSGPLRATTVVLLCATSGCLVLLAVGTAVRGMRIQHSEHDRNRVVSAVMNALVDTSSEWHWGVDSHGNFSFSSRASTSLLGYEPRELIGRPVSVVIDQDELASARQAVAGALGEHGTDWAGIPVAYRHRNGQPVWMEVSGRTRPAQKGRGSGCEGSSRPLTAQQLSERSARERIYNAIEGGMILTAFQPIHELATGTITGVEALARFPSDDGRSPDHWFSEASSTGLGGELEFAALEAAMLAAAELPPHLYVALNLSPETCLDPRLPVLLGRSGLAAARVVLELTERLPVHDYAPLLSALDPLRQRGLRVAVDDAGSGFSSMRHILQLRPDVIKLDRSLVAGLDRDEAKRALAAAMVDFARNTGAEVLAEGIETAAELDAVTQLGMTSGQGYFLGHPSLHPADWEGWKEARVSGTL